MHSIFKKFWPKSLSMGSNILSMALDHLYVYSEIYISYT